MKKNSNADYERFNSNHAPEDLPNSSVYRAHRDIIQERAGTVSVTQMMNSKSQTWDATTSSRTPSALTSNSTSAPTDTKNSIAHRAAIRNQASPKTKRKKFTKRFYANRKKRKPLVFQDKIGLRRANSKISNMTGTNVSEVQLDSPDTFHSQNLLLEWYERDQMPFVELEKLKENLRESGPV